MDKTSYHIKLYGQTSSDETLFCKRLAALLEITEDEARSFLQRTPVVVKEGLDRERAERLMELLGAIQALCLQEASETESGEEVEKSEAAPDAVPLEVREEHRETVRFKVWSVALGGAVAALLVFVLISYWVTSRESTERFTPPTRAESKQGSDQPKDAAPEESARSPQELLDEAQSEVWRIETELTDIGKRRNQAEEAARITSDPVEAGIRKRELRVLQQRANALRKDLEEARTALSRLQQPTE